MIRTIRGYGAIASNLPKFTGQALMTILSLFGSLPAYPAFAASNTIQQSIQSQQEQRLQELRKKNLAEESNVEPRDSQNPSKQVNDAGRASALYRHLVIERKMSHRAAIDALAKAGYPTDQITPHK